MKREGLKQQLIQELKHFSAVLLLAVLILSLCACGNSKGGTAAVCPKDGYTLIDLTGK